MRKPQEVMETFDPKCCDQAKKGFNVVVSKHGLYWKARGLHLIFFCPYCGKKAYDVMKMTLETS